jgi:hypothetical protein
LAAILGNQPSHDKTKRKKKDNNFIWLALREDEFLEASRNVFLYISLVRTDSMTITELL